MFIFCITKNTKIIFYRKFVTKDRKIRMEETKVITLKINKELSQLLDKAKKDYCINVSSLIRKLLIKELSNKQKYKGGNN